HLIEFLAQDEFLDPTGIEIDVVATAAAEIGEMLDGETEATRSGRSHHDPVAALGKILVAELFGELLVVVFVILPSDPLFGQAGGAAGFKNVEGPPLVGVGDETLVLLVAQPFVLKM